MPDDIAGEATAGDGDAAPGDANALDALGHGVPATTGPVLEPM
jgi:hypothetical protein